jgi:predicted metal-dependent hydrolase
MSSGGDTLLRRGRRSGGDQPRQRQLGELLAVLRQPSFTAGVPFDFILNPAPRSAPDEFLTVSGRQIPLALVRNLRARRYVLRLRPDGSARVTIPRGGSISEARHFAERQQAWLERQLERHAARPRHPKEWLLGTEIYFRGVPTRIAVEETGEKGAIRLGSEVVKVPDPTADLRPALERYLRRLAAKELPPRVLEFAALHQLPVRRITVRNQRSRWGSCSRRGTISLNWRLIQLPDLVRDYICLHELAHLREMNHSARFWREVEHLCPDYETAECWLKQHATLLR